MDLKLKDKLVIVTGSTGDGIGKHIAEELFRQGAYVVINGRSQGSVDKTIHEIAETNSSLSATKLIGVPGDASSDEGSKKFITDLVAVEGKLGIQVYGLVNNVGIFEAKDFSEISDDKWLEYYQTNTMSGVRLSRHFLPFMIKKNEGRIVFISSECGLRPLPHMMAYSVSKTSQIALARGLAEMTKGTAVTVNSVLPGPTMTGGVRKYMQEFAEMHNIATMDEAVTSYFKDAEPTSLLQRFLEPSEVAAVTVFTLSPLAAGVNGATQMVDGGVVRHI
jgi:NAD(P)-dependent dehydrogenase (short-subunit alcohol dehydrogenase family)